MPTATIKLLYLPRESFPTDRVRINVLFGSELLSRGHAIDLVMQAARRDVQLGPTPWFRRTVHVGRTDDGTGLAHRIHKHWLGIVHDLRWLLRARRPDWDGFLVADKFLVAVAGQMIARRRGQAFLFWLTFPIPELDLAGAAAGTARYPTLSRLRGLASGWLLYRWILPRCDHVFVQSERMKRNICAYGVDAAIVSPIVTGYDAPEFTRLRRGPPGTHSPVPTLAYLGTLSADRRLDVLVTMLALLRERGLKVQLLLVGDADRARDREALIAQAQRAGVSAQIEITGFLEHTAALELVSTADVCLSPIVPSPIYDVGSPTKLVEYLALGMPVVANTHPEQQEILRECRAGVCVPWGGRYFARAVAWLLRRSAAERALMGARGREWAESNRTYARIADDVERHCLAALRRHAVRGTPRAPR